MTYAHSNYQLRGHVVAARSIDEIRITADRIRSIMGLGDKPVHLAKFLESLFGFGITVDVVEDEDATLMLAEVEAACEPVTATIMLTEATYDAARRNDPRTRFTIFHELGHFILQHTKVLHRKDLKPERFQDSEWQADQFSAEITMPLSVIKSQGLKTAAEVASHFQVSMPAATYRMNQLRNRKLIR